MIRQGADVMNEMGTIHDKNTVRFERLLPGPIDRAWDHLTKPEHLSAWLMPSPEITENGLIDLQSQHPDPDGVLHRNIGIVSEFVPPHVLAYSWFDPPREFSSHIRFELEVRGEDVLLILTHTALPSDWMPMVGAGWHLHLEQLISLLRSGKATEFDYQQFLDLANKYSVMVAAAGIIVSTASPAIADGNSSTYASTKAEKSRLLDRYDRLWKDADELKRKADLLKRVVETNNDRKLDDIDRDLKDKLYDLRQVESDLRDVDKALL